MPYIREGINAKVRELFDLRLNSNFLQRNPMLYFLGMRSAEGMGKLGQPGANVVFGGADLGECEIDETIGSMERYFSYQIEEPNDGDSLEFGGAGPVASGFAEDNEGQTAFRWCHFKEPLKIRTHTLKFAKGESAIGSVVEKSSAPVFNKMLERINTQLWFGGTNANGSSTDMNSEAQQNKKLWKEPLGAKYAIGTSNNRLGRVDRSSATNLNPFSINASTDLATTVVDLDHNRNVNTGFVRKTAGTDFEGMSNINPNGVGCQLNVTTSALFNCLASQADARGIAVQNGGFSNYSEISKHSATGFRYPIIEHDNVWYTWDKDCPSGTMYHYDLDSILMEVDGEYNFSFSGFTDKSKTEEGGDEYEWAEYEAMFRLGWRCPWLMGSTTNLTAA